MGFSVKKVTVAFLPISVHTSQKEMDTRAVVVKCTFFWFF